MKLTSNVKVKPRWWNIVPMLSQFTANAIYPSIYLPETVYENLRTSKPKAEYLAILLHEQEHIKRQKVIGVFRFGLQYLLSPTFRFNEELIAMKPQMRYLKSVNKPFDTALRAKYLSGWLYLWAVSFTEAKRKLDQAWEDTI